VEKLCFFLPCVLTREKIKYKGVLKFVYCWKKRITKNALS